MSNRFSFQHQLAALSGLGILLASSHSFATITYSYDRTSIYSIEEMNRPDSSGETLADLWTPVGPGPYENVTPDLWVSFTWSDGTTQSGNWSLDAGAGIPGVTFSGLGSITQTGDTFTNPWTIQNLSSNALNKVVLSATGILPTPGRYSPDMGFDTDNGTPLTLNAVESANQTHGASGFVLSTSWNGDLVVTYDWWNNWAGTTDMFHRMTLDFTTPLASGQSLVFFQDTDEQVPAPAPLALITLGLAALGVTRRWRAE